MRHLIQAPAWRRLPSGWLTLLPLTVFVLAASAAPVRFELVALRNQPVIGWDHPDAVGNLYGFEDGTTVKIGGVYHVVVCEMIGNPLWCRMRIAHWTSPDAIRWRREGTLRETSGLPHATTGLPYDSVWGSNVVFDDDAQRWDLFYTGYDVKGTEHGRIWRAVSTRPGREGIGGPYADTGVVFQPDEASQPWEGSQGTDSFFPYRAGGGWLAFYGSHDDSRFVWQVGLAAAPKLDGPWRRLPHGNPLPIEPILIENPIVTRVGGLWVAVYDRDVIGPRSRDANNVGVTVSADGLHWSPGGRIRVQPPGPANWSDCLRTPLGLVPEGNGEFTLLYTAKVRNHQYWAVGAVRLRVVAD